MNHILEGNRCRQSKSTNFNLGLALFKLLFAKNEWHVTHFREFWN